jgi:hypothetical protein
LMRQWQNYFWDSISRIGGWGINTQIIKTETLLHLKLGNYFSVLSLSLYCLFSLLLIRTVSLTVYYLKIFVCLLFCLLVYLFFTFLLPSFLSLSSHPSILNITIVIITS